MRQREHLSGFCVSAVYEHKRREVVRKRKTAKLFGIETTSIIVQDHAATHNHDSRFICLRDEESQSFGPCWHSAALFKIKSEIPSYHRRGRLDAAVQACRANEGQWQDSFSAREVAVPLLTLLTDIDHVEQVGTRASDCFVSDSSEIGYRNLFNWRLLKKQKADRRMRSLGEVF